MLNLLHLPDDYALSVFISNLKPEISKPVRLFYLKTLTHAFNLAKQLESLLFNIPKKPYSTYKNTNQSTSPYIIRQPPPKSELPPLLPTPKGSFFSPQQPKFTPSLNTARLYNNKLEFNSNKLGKPPTKKEKDERKRKGLCIHCGVKFTFGHRCVRSQLYNMLVEESTERAPETDEFFDCGDKLEKLLEEEDHSQQLVVSLHAM